MASRKNEEPVTKDDVQIIRQILFGDQIEALSVRIDRLEAALGEIRKSLENEISARQAADEAELSQVAGIKQDIKSDLDRLNDHLVEETEKKIQGQRKSIDRMNRKVDRLNRQLRKDMAGHERQLENLVGSLASALTEYSGTGEGESE